MSHHQDRLVYLVKNYYKSDLERVHQNYERICDKYQVEKKDFLNDVSLYSHVNVLGVSTIHDTIRNESLRIIPVDKVEKFKKRKRGQTADDENESAAKSNKSTKTCSSCGGTDFIFLCNGASDCMYLEFPNGRTVERQTPKLTALTDGDGISIHVCIGCGKVHGFNSDLLKEDLQRYEFALEDLNETDQEELLYQQDDE